jgi:uncharacterized protein (UPF0332 family)
MIDTFLKKEQLVKDITAKNLAESYFRKSRVNLVTMEILSKVEKHKELLAIPKDHSTEEWVVVIAYYSMYMAALSLLAKIGFKSKSHIATAAALEEFFVKKRLLDKTHFENFENVRMRKEEVELLIEIKDRREIAQYSVTKKTTKELAEETKEYAHKFVDGVEEIFEKL